MKKWLDCSSLCLLLFFCSSVAAQLKVGDQPTSLQKSVAIDVQGSSNKQGLWISRISDTTNATGIDGLNPPDGMLIFYTPSQKLMIRSNGYWFALLTSTTTGLYYVNADGKTILGPEVNIEIGIAAGGSKDFNLAVVPGQNRLTFNLPDASNDTRGVVTINSQTLAGLKTFQDGISVSTQASVSGNTANASNLYLGIRASTATSTTATKYLSVDNSGRVILVTNSSAGIVKIFLPHLLQQVQCLLVAAITLTFNLPAASNLTQPATVVVTPKLPMVSGLKINWATITASNVISVSFSCPHFVSSQTIAVTDEFYFTVTEF